MPRPVLLTAGATRNPVDAMRYVSAYSSGRTGVFIAHALAEQGADVHVLGSPEARLRLGDAVPSTEFGSTRDLMTRMEEWIRENPGGAVIHSAAVGDFEAAPNPGKISSQQDELVLRLTRTPKIADHVLGWDPRCFLVTFKAAAPNTDAEQLIAIARLQLRRTGSALVFGNVIGALGSTSTLVDASGAESFQDRERALRALCARTLAS